MKAIIEFNLDDQDDLDSYNMCNSASKMHSAIWQFDQKLRSMYKYEGNEEAGKIRGLLYEYLNEYNIKI